MYMRAHPVHTYNESHPGIGQTLPLLLNQIRHIPTRVDYQCGHIETYGHTSNIIIITNTNYNNNYIYM